MYSNWGPFYSLMLRPRDACSDALSPCRHTLTVSVTLELAPLFARPASSDRASIWQDSCVKLVPAMLAKTTTSRSAKASTPVEATLWLTKLPHGKQGAMHSLTKKAARLLLGEYSAYHIYAFSAGNCRALARHDTNFRFANLEQKQLEASDDPSIAEHANYHGPQTYAYACFEGTRIVGVCYFWYGAQYRKRNFWPLGDSEAKLVQVFTLEEMRGRGIATQLIAYAADDMLRKGFERLYSRIWHSNKPSLKAFQHAGWARVATVVEIYPLRRKVPCRVTFRLQRA